LSPRPSVEEQRRHELVTVACELIAEQGYAAVRIADVAERARVSRAAVHYYFGNRNSLLEAALEYAHQAARERRPTAVPGETAPELLIRIVDRYLPTDEEELTWRVYLRFWNEALTNPELRPSQAAHYAIWRDFVSTVVADGQRAGTLADGDPDDMAATLLGMLDGLGIQAILEAPDMPVERVRQLCVAYIETLTSSPAVRT
jgi:AcrR family transcriptional regulator